MAEETVTGEKTVKEPHANVGGANLRGQSEDERIQLDLCSRGKLGVL